MGVTVGVNGMSVVHAGSGGVSIATPDPCKLQAGPVLLVLPLPNVAESKNLAQGTKKVTCDGQPVAIDGSTLDPTTGDEAGAQGGVVSGKTKGKAAIVGFSMDVMFEGKGVARANDMATHNEKNTPPAPILQGPLDEAPDEGPNVCAICDEEY